MTDGLFDIFLAKTYEVVITPFVTPVVTFVLGGAGAAITAKLSRQKLLRNADFRITTECTEITFRPQGGNQGNLQISIHRKFTQKLKTQQNGTYPLFLDLKGDSVSGEWDPDCALYVNDKQVPLIYDEDRSVLRSEIGKVRYGDTINITLHSNEIVSRRRGFYMLSITNPKDDTTLYWDFKDLPANDDIMIKAFASSEDFGLIMLQSGEKQTIYKSSHPVAYFFTWNRELFK